MKYQEIDVEDAPKTVQMWVKKLLESDQPAADYKQHRGYTYVFITLGRKKTTGYRIDVEPETMGDGHLEITIRKVEPTPWQFTAQVINHPSMLIRFDSIYPKIEFQYR